MEISIAGDVVSTTHENFQTYLQSAYTDKIRPKCLCNSSQIEMYIAKINNQYVLKRMPNTGKLHNPNCLSYEAPAELSGLGDVQGQAIQENQATGETNLKFEFSLSKRPGKAPPAASSAEKDSVQTDGKKLTLRGLLHYLYEQGKLNYWSPSDGQKNWYGVRKNILSATADKIAKRMDLHKILYVPEVFNIDHKDEIAQRRREDMRHLYEASKGQNLMIVIGEVKRITEARYDYKLVAKHCPDFHFFMNKDLHKRINERFEREFQLWNYYEDKSHLLFICTISKTASDLPLVNELSLMLVNQHWIPFESKYEYELIEHMQTESRQFIKGLRYNLPSDAPLASFVLVDTVPKPTALYIGQSYDNDAYLQKIEKLREDSELDDWVWLVNDTMPPLPIQAREV